VAQTGQIFQDCRGAYVRGKRKPTARYDSLDSPHNLLHLRIGEAQSPLFRSIVIEVFSQGSTGVLFRRMTQSGPPAFHLLKEFRQYLLGCGFVRRQWFPLLLAVLVLELPVPFR
jgi:hypothetical protein